MESVITKQKSVLDYALSYHASGLKCVPVPHGAKFPPYDWKTFTECNYTTEFVEQLFKDHDEGIAILTGSCSDGLVVVDVDNEEALKTLNLPKTVTVKTSRGVHLYYKTDKKLATRAGVLPGVDIRAEGGLVIAPPTVHGSGKTYQFVDDLNTPISPLTKELADIIELKHQISNDKINIYELLVGVGEGQRNDSAARIAGHYLRLNLSDDEIMSILRLWNAQNKPPMPEGELFTVFSSIKKAEQKKRDEESTIIVMSPAPSFLKNVPDIIEYNISNLYPKSAYIIEQGEPKVGKSAETKYKALMMALGISNGPLIVKKKVSVGYFSWEDPAILVKRRLNQYARGMGHEIPENLYFPEKWRQLILPDNLRPIIAAIVRYNLGVVVFDTFSYLHASEENNASEMKKVSAAIREIINETGVTLIAIHHTSKPSAGAARTISTNGRGSSAISAAPEVIIQHIRNENETTARCVVRSKYLGKEWKYSVDYEEREFKNGEPQVVLWKFFDDSVMLTDTDRQALNAIRTIEKRGDNSYSYTVAQEIGTSAGIIIPSINRLLRNSMISQHQDDKGVYYKVTG